MNKHLLKHRFAPILSGMLIFVMVAANAAAEEPDNIPLPLSEGLRLVLGRNPDLRIDALSYAGSEADVARSYGMYDPFLTASASGSGDNRARDNAGMDKSADFSLGISQLLPTGGTFAANVQTGFTAISGTHTDEVETPGVTLYRSFATATLNQPVLKNAGKQITEFSITTAKNVLEDAVERYRLLAIDTTSSFIAIYNRLYSARQGVVSKQQSLAAAQALLDETNVRQLSGTASRLDLINAEYAVVQRQKDLVDAERNVRDLEGSLRIILDTTDPRPLYPSDPPSLDEPLETEDQAVSMAKEMRPDLRQLRLALKLAELQERISRNQTLPDLLFTGSAGLRGFGTSFGETLTQMGYGEGFWSLTANLSYPIGNKAATNDYRKAKIRTEQLKTQIAALEMKTENDIRTDMRAIISARLQLRVTKKAREAAEQRLEENKESNKRGESTMQNVLEAEADLSFARISEIDAAEAFSAAVVKLWRDMGVLLERKGVKFVKPGERSPERDWQRSVLPVAPPPAPAPSPPPVVTPQPAPATAVPAPVAVSEAVAKPLLVDGSGFFYVQIVDPQGLPLRQGVRIHDVSDRELRVEPNGIVGIPMTDKRFVSIVAYPDDWPCWAVVPVAAEPVPAGVDVPPIRCNPVSVR